MRSVRVPGPRRLEARRANAAIKGLYDAHPSSALIMASHPLTVPSPNPLQGSVLGPVWAVANSTTSAAALAQKMWCHQMRRNGNATPARMQSAVTAIAAPPFHGLVDPTTPKLPYILILEDMVTATIAAGSPEVLYGLIEHITAGVVNTLVGVGFRAGTDGLWHCFVRDCPGNTLPVTVRHDVATAISMSDFHRLSIIIDGSTKTITWMIDRAVASTFTPAAPLDQMGSAASGPAAMVAACVPANADVTVRSHAGQGNGIRLVILNR
jgi:hypothetical protein